MLHLRRHPAGGVVTPEEAVRLDLAGYRSLLPDLTGNEQTVAVAGVFRAAVIADIVALTAAAGGDALDGAYRRWLRAVANAPTEAAWWVANEPTTAGALVHALDPAVIAAKKKTDEEKGRDGDDDDR